MKRLLCIAFVLALGGPVAFAGNDSVEGTGIKKTAQSRVENLSEFLKTQHPRVFQADFAIGPRDLQYLVQKGNAQVIVDLLFYTYRSPPLEDMSPEAKTQLVDFQQRLLSFLNDPAHSELLKAIQGPLFQRTLKEYQGANFGFSRQAIRAQGLLKPASGQIWAARLDMGLRNYFDTSLENNVELARSAFTFPERDNLILPKELYTKLMSIALELERRNEFQPRGGHGTDVPTSIYLQFSEMKPEEVRQNQRALADFLNRSTTEEISEEVAGKLLAYADDLEIRSRAREILLSFVSNPRKIQNLSDNPVVLGSRAAQILAAYSAANDHQAKKAYANALNNPVFTDAERFTIARELLRKNKGDTVALRYMLSAFRDKKNFGAAILLANLYPENPKPVEQMVAHIQGLIAKKDLAPYDKLKSAILLANYRDREIKIPAAVFNELEKMLELMDPDQREFEKEEFDSKRDKLLAPTGGKSVNSCERVFAK